MNFLSLLISCIVLDPEKEDPVPGLGDLEAEAEDETVAEEVVTENGTGKCAVNALIGLII